MGQHHTDGLLVLLLFAVFAACVLAVLFTGAGSYRRLVRRDTDAFDRRTAVQYVATRVRQADAASPAGEHGVFVGSFDGTVRTASENGAAVDRGDTLFLEENYDGTVYYTRVYWYDGSVRELFTEAEADAAPEDGETVLAAAGLDFTLSRGLLTVTAAAVDGAETELILSLRSGKEAAS